jgi:hypothetical protein
MNELNVMDNAFLTNDEDNILDAAMQILHARKLWKLKHRKISFYSSRPNEGDDIIKTRPCLKKYLYGRNLSLKTTRSGKRY